jgi:cysteine-rich repeat protein
MHGWQNGPYPLIWTCSAEVIMQRIMLLAVLVAACSADPVSDSSGAADTDAPADCGDGVISLHEECDDGDANSDSEPNACRSTCREARCGDGVQDRSEECDDGDLWGGDGCGPTCQIERGQLETEPNDSPFQAQTLDDTVVIGSLPSGDVDCYFVPGDGEVHATVLPDDDHGCAAQAVLRIRGEAGNEVLSAGPDETGCAAITPERHEEARSLPRGPHAVCIEGLLGAKVTQYRLEVLSSKVERTLQACLDGEDNDEDGAADCDDSDCASYIPCAACDAADLGSETGRALIADVELDTNRAAGSCGGLRGPEAVTSWTAPSTGRFVATSVAWERKVVLYATSGDCRGEEIACDARDRNSRRRGHWRGDPAGDDHLPRRGSRRS